MAVRHSRAVQRLSSATRRAESHPSRIGSISFGVKQMGARNAGNPHVACDVEGTGNVARSSGLPARQSSTLPMSGMWKRSHSRTSKAPPDERGGNRYVLPNATAPHVGSSLNNGSQDHSLVPAGRLVAFDPRSGFLFSKQKDFGCE